MPNDPLNVDGLLFQEAPRIYMVAIPGHWLLEHTTPSWRINDPEEGFQRLVREERAREIALAVLDQQRSFPNAIVLATDKPSLKGTENAFELPARIKFLVVDGQHRLWAQKYSRYEAHYACMIHMGLSEVDMARLFLEINDNQKRVPSSLRWDLVRLVRPDDDPFAIAAVEMVYQLANEPESPLYQRIDLTGEQSEIYLKQASLAPDLKQLLSRRSPLSELSFEQQYRVVMQFFVALRSLDRDNWGKPDSTFYKARIIRALLRLLQDLVNASKKEVQKLTYRDFLPYLEKIDVQSLGTEEIRAAQGSAGIKAIYDQIHTQVMGQVKP